MRRRRRVATDLVEIAVVRFLLPVGHVTLGLDTTVRLDRRDLDWAAFIVRWGVNRPAYYGAYFGTTGHPWVPGELTNLAPMSPLQSVKHILPFGPTGPYEAGAVLGLPARNLVGHGIPTTVVDNLAIFYRQEGMDDHGNVLGDRRARSQGAADAKRTCDTIATALRIDPATQKSELRLPASGRVFVFLNVEPWTILSVNYWRGWSQGIASYLLWQEDTNGLVVPLQPFLPCLYCGFELSGPYQEIRDALATDQRALKRHSLIAHNPCRVFMTGAGGFRDQAGSLAKTEAVVQGAWPAFHAFAQPPAPDAEVLIWQYQINMEFPPQVPGEPVFKMDISATKSVGYDGRPITDFMLERTP
jgi:hypothetical protein